MALHKNEHLEYLSSHVFRVDDIWPQFKLLVQDLESLSNIVDPGSVVVCLERTLLYGGVSLIAPVFQDCKLISLDCSPKSAYSRGSYNSALVDDHRFIRVPSLIAPSQTDTGLASNSVDLVLVPNLVHHVKDQFSFFSEISRILKPGGKVYVFEPLVRELHQAPDDFLRYTPYGLESIYISVGLHPEPYKSIGGPFHVLSYCWTQALQYLHGEAKEKYTKWFEEFHFKELLDLDVHYSKNLEKNNSSFPMAFSMIAKKPSSQFQQG